MGLSEENLKKNNQQWTDPAKLMNLVVDQWMENTNSEPISWQRLISILKADGVMETWRADNVYKQRIGGGKTTKKPTKRKGLRGYACLGYLCVRVCVCVCVLEDMERGTYACSR